MKSASFIFDRRLYELLQEEGHTRFTTGELRDAYAKRLEGITFRIGDVRRYVYEQIRRMVRKGWLVHDEERRARGQVYHLQPIPAHLQLELIDNGFENSLKTAFEPEQEPSVIDTAAVPLKPSPDADEHLEALHKEIRLDFLSSMGEAERYKLLLDDMPHLRDKVEGEYLEARDRSSRLLGHLRAIEKTLKTLAAAR
ncbi:hypothetical protein ACIGKL_15210 [Pseudomonas sp. NPDC077186]|uniref:Response regulator n=1 Tax=Pseudomonas triclosanedens TaxID=2961893 RepID=A0ABY6ZYL4_9PSED|nr:MULTISPECIES: hypothetical protein [Pseudomonas]MCP8473064.1 hypothetical protein [Pseudomonas triclosanedens]MCP8479112.1 hypothetical protein [Pseudomonas triclosanedens]MCP8462599.1 hypothetical protein [Pseudomonas triclosanedens]WAI49790.1 hypothetical protein OU419_00540 [Pseudomonas triclosanedens]WRS33921.1 hypothetical protein U9S62_30500 [Pseudomonas aeruginosa]